MSVFVLDSSVALSWCLPMEAREDTIRVHQLAEAGGAVVPALWRLEITNILGNKLKNGVISSVTVKNALDLLAVTRLTTDRAPLQAGDLFPLISKYALTAYDAVYLELGLRLQLPIATLDRQLSRARELAGLPVLRKLMS